MSCSLVLAWCGQCLGRAQTNYHHVMAAAKKGQFCLFLAFGTGRFSWLFVLPRGILLRKCRNSIVPLFAAVSIHHAMHIHALLGTQGWAGQEEFWIMEINQADNRVCIQRTAYVQRELGSSGCLLLLVKLQWRIIRFCKNPLWFP